MIYQEPAKFLLLSKTIAVMDFNFLDEAPRLEDKSVNLSILLSAVSSFPFLLQHQHTFNKIITQSFNKIIYMLNCLMRADHGMRLHCTWGGAEMNKTAWAKCWLKVVCTAACFEAFFPEKLLTNILLLSPIHRDIIQLLCSFLLNVIVKHDFQYPHGLGNG